MKLPFLFFPVACATVLCSCDSSEKSTSDALPWRELEKMGIQYNQYEARLLSEASRGTLRMVRLLLRANTNINTTDADGRTPLHLAAKSGRIRIVKLLVENGANIHAKDNHGQTPLALALHYRHESTANHLRQHGAQEPAQQPGTYIHHLAETPGAADRIKQAIASGSDPDAQDANKWTPLFYSVSEGETGNTKALIEAGASVNMKDSSNWTPLHMAAFKGFYDDCLLLLNAGADVNAMDNAGHTPLHDATRSGKIRVVQLLLSRGAATDIRNKENLTPLELAQQRKKPAVVALLQSAYAKKTIARQANINIHQSAETPGAADQIKQAVAVGINPDARDSRKWTPLFYATANLQTANTKALIESGANVNARDKDNWTPLHSAAFKGGVEDCELLIRAGADINATDDFGRTPLHDAARTGKTRIVELLLRKGASPTTRCKQGRTPMDWARQNGHSHLLPILQKALQTAAALRSASDNQSPQNPLDLPGKELDSYTNPYADGTYEHFAAAKEYPFTPLSYTDAKLLRQATSDNSRLIICLPQQRARFYVNGKVAMDWAVSTGADGHLTPTGLFRIQEKRKKGYRSRRYGRFMNAAGHVTNGHADLARGMPEGHTFEGFELPCWHRFSPDGIGLHSGIVIPGKRLSRGTIHTHEHIARKFFRYSALGTPVYITSAVEDYNKGGHVNPEDLRYRPIPGNDYTDNTPYHIKILPARVAAD